VLRRHPLLSAVGVVLVVALLALFAVLVVSDSSTAPLALVWVPLYTVGAILVVLLVRLVARSFRVARDFRDDDRRV
jgi:Kef-type K+ transport system membrane component KefB